MKKTILTLFAVVVTIAASAQNQQPLNIINQGLNESHANNQVFVYQLGKTETKVTQKGSTGSVETFHRDRDEWAEFNNYTVTLDQVGSDNQINTSQWGVGSYNSITISQIGNNNSANAGQLSDESSVSLIQNGNGNNAESIQNYNYNGTVNLTQVGDNNNAIIWQGRYPDIYSDDNFSSIRDNTINATQEGGSLAFGNFLEIYQSGNLNLIELKQTGDNNKLTITQSGSANRITGLDLSDFGLGLQSGNNNIANLRQSGQENTIIYRQATNNTNVDFEQSGRGNVGRVIVDENLYW